ncbi:MAG: FtsQ-type POTRA domain-containing protein [Erysipelotrichaceae bacterium]|nr:FtsQ-type POTRA domain-containing protein [Erysipelotrichaceae bacterium]
MKNKKKGIKRLVKILIIIIIVIGICWYLKDLKIKNIYIKGNTTLKDYEIIELAGIQDYPNMFSISSRKIEQKLKMNKLISSVKVKKNLFGKIVIIIKEEKMLVKNELDNTIYLANLEKITDDNKVIGIPTLINDVPSDILNKFLEKLKKIDSSVLSKISEISYKPNEYDKDLFLFLMNDGNYVYITTTKLSNIDKYENVLIQLEGKKGIIYLDSGNHFEIF